MRQKALAEQTGDERRAAADSYALAIEPDASQAAILERILTERIGGILTVVGSTDEAFSALERRIPDLILVSPLLAPQDEEKIVARPKCYVTLTIDHRVMDGHQANRFLQTFVRTLESWPRDA